MLSIEQTIEENNGANHIDLLLTDIILQKIDSMAFRSNEGYNLSLKGNSVQPPPPPSGNLSSRPASARTHGNPKQPTTTSRAGYFEGEVNIDIVTSIFHLGSARDQRVNPNLSAARQR